MYNALILERNPKFRKLLSIHIDMLDMGVSYQIVEDRFKLRKHLAEKGAVLCFLDDLLLHSPIAEPKFPDLHKPLAQMYGDTQFFYTGGTPDQVTIQYCEENGVIRVEKYVGDLSSGNKMDICKVIRAMGDINSLLDRREHRLS